MQHVVKQAIWILSHTSSLDWWMKEGFVRQIADHFVSRDLEYNSILLGIPDILKFSIWEFEYSV